jgi:hypothetical protein
MAHESRLARALRGLLHTQRVAALGTPGQPVRALPHLTLATQAHPLHPDHPWHPACRAAYLSRFPEAEPMTALPDFRFVALQVLGARQVAGFGAARSVGIDELQRALATAA